MDAQVQRLIDGLPPDLLREVEDFVVFLHERRQRPARRSATLSWAGSAKDLDPGESSVAVQHRISALREEQA